MTPEKTHHYREILLQLRNRTRGEFDHVLAAMQPDMNANANVSAAPMHLADVAEDAVDADVRVLQTEHSILEEINAALIRLDDGTFGECTTCGRTISDQRLKAIPYSSTCVACARTESLRDST